MRQDPVRDDPIFLADMVDGRVRLRTVGGDVLEIEAPCVAYVPHDPDAEAAVQGPRLKSIVRLVEREDWEGGKSWLRVEARHDRRWDLPEALKSAGLVPHESDVSPARRFLSEHDGVRIARQTVDVLFDLECDSSVPLHQHAEGKAPILLISYAVGLDGPVRSIRLPAIEPVGERDMLVEFRRRLRLLGCHLLVAWNGKGYDEPVLRKRAEALGLGSDFWDEFQFLDLLACYRSHFLRGESGDQRVSFALDSLAEQLVGERKVDLRQALAARGLVVHPSRPAVTREAFDAHPDLLTRYGERDVYLMQALERRKHFLALQKACAAMCRTPPGDKSLYKSELCDGVMLRVGRQTGVHFRNKPKVDDEQRFAEQAEGAEILETAPPGLYAGVAVLDFAGMYTSIIDGANISPETRLEDGEDAPHCTTPNGARFRTDVLGIFPRVIAALRRRRVDAKARAKRETDPQRQLDVAHESDSIKVVMNSFYGLILGKFSRYYDKDCGEGVTTSAKVMLRTLCAVVVRRGGTVLGGDTDASTCLPPVSMLLSCPIGRPGCAHVDVREPVAECVAWAREQRWPRPELLELEHETTFLKFLIGKRRGEDAGAKKRYAGTAIYYKGAHLDHPKLEVKGFETMRADGAPLMRQLLGDVLSAAMLGDASPAELRGFVDLARDRVLGGRAGVDDLLQRKGIHKPLDEYEGDDPHVRVARRMAEAGWLMGEGSKVDLVVTGRDRAGKVVAVHPSEWDGRYDARTTWDERVYEPTREALEVLHPDLDWSALGWAGVVAKQADLFSAPKPPPPLAARPDGREHRNHPEAGTIVEVGPRASRGDLVRLRLAALRSPGVVPVDLRIAVDGGCVEVPLPGAWRCDPAALRSRLSWSDQVRLA